MISLFFNSLIRIGAPWHAVSSSKVNEKCISLSRFDFEKIGAKAKVHAMKPFISHEPLPKSLLSLIVAWKGSVAQPFDTGTTSVCPDKIIGFLLLVFFALIVANRFTLFLSSSNVLKELAPRSFKMLSQ